jgi:ArsR family transcriptional regulator
MAKYGRMRSMRNFMAITKALADRNRIGILLALEGRELCVCQIIEIIRLAPSTVSKHLSILRQSRLIEDRKEGRWMYYRLAGQDGPVEAQEAIAWVFRSVADTPDARVYKEKAQEILAISPVELCKGHL